MINSDFVTYFTTMTAVGGTLLGLIFVAVSIAPESIVQKGAPIGRQVRAASAYNALLNPLVISLFALIPHEHISYAALVMSAIGLITTLFIATTLLPQSSDRHEHFRDILFIVVALVIYIFEAYYSLYLLRSASDTDALDGLVIVLIVMYIFGLARAWALIGVRQFPTQDRSLTSNK